MRRWLHALQTSWRSLTAFYCKRSEQRVLTTGAAAAAGACELACRGGGLLCIDDVLHALLLFAS